MKIIFRLNLTNFTFVIPPIAVRFEQTFTHKELNLDFSYF